MWAEFNFFLQLGFTHIADWAGRDHILFLLVLAGNYFGYQWRSWLPVISAFTVAHSITLILSVYEIIQLSSRLIEIAIAGTILFTAVENILERKFIPRTFSASLFGLIHGLGFSGILREIFGLHGEKIAIPLLSFNVGLELGQIVILIVIWFAIILLHKAFSTKISRVGLFKIISWVVLLQAGYWLIERSFAL